MRTRTSRVLPVAFLGPIAVLVLLLASAAQARADRRVFFAPAATGNGSGSDAANARAFDYNFTVYRALANDPDPVVEIHFAPGTYSLRAFLFSPASGDRERIVVRIRGDGERPEDTVIRNDKPLVMNAEDRMVRLNGLGRIELENLTFDGNWDEKVRQAGHAAFNPNYKNHPLNLTARTGRVRRVIVRNCGSIGYLPQSRFDNVAGTEAFPLSVGTTDAGQEPAPGDPAPWVVEDCEVHGFHPEYGGYATLVMAGGSRVAGVTPQWAAEDPDRRMVVVRRCQVRGVPGGAGIIAFGSAGCGPGEVDGGRVTYADNVLLNASLGFNTDCGRLVNFWATNSVFLDVWSLGNIGALYPGTMDRYRVSGNSVRLAGRGAHPTYLDYAWRGGRQVTDPALVLGRRDTNEVTGIGVGAAGQLRWEGNWFTTRPRAQFAAEGVEPAFRLFRKYTAADTAAAGGFAEVSGMEASGNALSSAAWDFVRTGPLPGGSHPRFGPDTVPELTRMRTALEPAPDGFRPFGTVERVLPRWTTRTVRWRTRLASGATRDLESAEPVLAGVVEAALGEPSLDPRGDLRVSARLVLQPTPSSGQFGTTPLRGLGVRVELDGPVVARLSGTTDARGIADFRVPAGSWKPGLLRMRVVHDPGARGEQPPFREYQSAFATAVYPLGNVVLVEANPDFAQAGGQRARLVFTRTGRTPAELPEMEAYFRLSGDARPARWGDEFELAVPPGARANFGNFGNGGVARITFAAGERAFAVDVVPRPRASERNSLVGIRLLPGAGQSYGVGEGTATVFLHQGPEWAFELLPTPPGSSARATALGDAYISGRDLLVHAVGRTTDAAGRDGAVLWRWHSGRRQWEDLSSRVPDFNGVRPVAVGRSPEGETPVIAGNRVDARGLVPWVGNGVALGVPNGLGTPRLVTMSDDARWIAGVTGGAGTRRPLAWRGEGEALAPALPPGTTDAEPVAIDPSGRMAANARRDRRGLAFRTGPELAGPWEPLAPLGGMPESVAADMASSGVVVGWSASGDSRRAVAWMPGGGASPVELSRADAAPEAAAFGVDPAGEVVAMAGRGGRLDQPFLVMAVPGGAWKPLWDAHHVAGIPSGLEWGSPVAINDQGWIVGNGRLQGRDVVWVLRRQRPR